MDQCKGTTKSGNRCRRKVKSEYCYQHKPPEKKEKFLQEKPEECPVCYESFSDIEKPLECGHWVHLECVKKHFRPNCPVCEARLNIEVTGSIPPVNITTDINDILRDVPIRHNFLVGRPTQNETDQEVERELMRYLEMFLGNDNLLGVTIILNDIFSRMESPE